MHIYTVEYVFNDCIHIQLSDIHYDAQMKSNWISTSCIGIITEPVRIMVDQFERRCPRVSVID